MKIEKHYSRVVNLGNYESLRVGVTLSKELDSPITEAQLRKVSDALFNLCVDLVEKEIEKLKKGGLHANQS